MKKKQLLLICAFIVFALVCLCKIFASNHPQNTQTKETVPVATTTSTFTINNVALEVGIADTDASRVKGLSGKVALTSNEGLLFVFDKSDTYGIWMKDMNFPIDIFWLDENLKVIDIKEGATPESYPTVFRPTKKALYVLETNVGFAARNKIHAGDQATLSQKP